MLQCYLAPIVILLISHAHTLTLTPTLTETKSYMIHLTTLEQIYISTTFVLNRRADEKFIAWGPKE